VIVSVTVPLMSAFATVSQVAINSGVVHEHVNIAISAPYFGCGLLDTAFIRDILRQRLDLTAAEFLRGPFHLCSISCCEQHDEVFLGQLPADFKSDPSIGTGY
jgi:hypothetical protein